jgi:hypothetical protein
MVLLNIGLNLQEIYWVLINVDSVNSPQNGGSDESSVYTNGR